MTNRHLDLARLGWDAWFEERGACGPAETVARVAAVDRELLLLMDHTGTYRARLAGSYLYRHPLVEDLPCVGDWVGVARNPADDYGVVHRVLERRTALRRRAAGAGGASQMIAANVDGAIIVQSCHYDFNLKRLERYLVMVRDGGVDPWILLTKTDLVEPEVLDSQVTQIRAAGVTAPLLTLSNVTGEGIDELKRVLLPARTYCFVGSSGVGKSTLINQLLGREDLVTRSVSVTGEGRHTTVRRELHILAGGALVIDNPGMREFGLLGAEDGLGGSFADLLAFSANCRYRDCSHDGEPGCAVLAAVAAGELSREHYASYLKLRGESEFYQMTYAEKRKKDRDFGRFIKSVKKDHRK